MPNKLNITVTLNADEASIEMIGTGAADYEHYIAQVNENGDILVANSDDMTDARFNLVRAAVRAAGEDR